MQSISIEHIDHNLFRQYLLDEFERRNKSNKQYSLRAFAKNLDIHASCLSVILRGKRPLTNKLVSRFISNLSLEANELERLSKAPAEQVKDYKQLELDSIHFVSDWKHDALIELFKCEEYSGDIKAMAKCLEISPTEVQMTLERLQRLEIVKETKEGWILLTENTEIQVNEITNAALKNYQKLALEKSKDALMNTKVEERYHGTTTLALDKAKIPEAKKMLREFRLKFCSEMQKENTFNDIYQINIGFYPVTARED